MTDACCSLPCQPELLEKVFELQVLQFLVNRFLEHFFDVDDFDLLFDFAQDGGQVFDSGLLFEGEAPLLGEANSANVLLPPAEVL